MANQWRGERSGRGFFCCAAIALAISSCEPTHQQVQDARWEVERAELLVGARRRELDTLEKVLATAPAGDSARASNARVVPARTALAEAEEELFQAERRLRKLEE